MTRMLRLSVSPSARTPRRRLAGRATLGALALAAPVLASCGFSEATNAVYVPATGTFDRNATVDVSGAVIVSSEGGEGTFIANFANKNPGEAAAVEAIGGDVTSEEFEPAELPAGGALNLAVDDQGIGVTGDFEIGDFVEVTIAYSGGQEVSWQVPVVPNSGYYEGLDDGPVTEFEEFPTEELYTPADEVVPGGSEVE